MSRKPEVVDVDYDAIEHETEKAYLFKFDEKTEWLPKSIVTVDKKDKVVTMPYKAAYDRGLI